ncbi:MAG: SAM-dependent methyltransferase [Legionellales bacterium]|nr:SAM-dependent methyltransferase [Legionellales bacterium]
MNDKIKKKWDENYDSCLSNYPSPAEVLRLNQHLLPKQGTALDLACGRGANAICLAENGLSVSAWDISISALKHLSSEALKKNLKIKFESRDISKKPPASDSFNVITVSHFLDRELIDDIKNAIKKNGLVFYQTFIINKVNDVGPNNPDYLLEKNELLDLFNDWNTIYYREEGTTGKIDEGFRDQAMLIAQKL